MRIAKAFPDKGRLCDSVSIKKAYQKTVVKAKSGAVFRLAYYFL